MDWKSLYSNAFPKKQPFAAYSWPKLEKAGPGEASSYPALDKAGPGEASSYPQLSKDTSSPPGGVGADHRTFDHVGLFGFRIEIEGLSVGAFTKVEGLTVSVETIEYQHSNDITPRKRMGRVKVENVKLIKGYLSTPDLYEWCLSAMKGDIERRAVSIILLDDDRSREPIRYNLFECWPCKWSGFRLDASNTGALVEEIELVVEELEVA